MKIKPTADFVFFSVPEKKENKGEIILSDISSDRQFIGLVDAIGPEVKNIKVGDKIIFNPFILRELNLDGKKIYLIKSKDIYGVIGK